MCSSGGNKLPLAFAKNRQDGLRNLLLLHGQQPGVMFGQPRVNTNVGTQAEDGRQGNVARVNVPVWESHQFTERSGHSVPPSPTRVCPGAAGPPEGRGGAARAGTDTWRSRKPLAWQRLPSFGHLASWRSGPRAKSAQPCQLL